MQTDFLNDYKQLIRELKSASRVKIYVCLPPPRYPVRHALERDIIPLIREVARSTGSTLIDLHTPLLNQQVLFPDGLHPNNEGAAIIAGIVQEAIQP